MKTSSNAYTIMYSAILVVVVAFLLAFVSQSLKTRQDANVALDKKKQILYSLNIRDLDGEEAEKAYSKVVKVGLPSASIFISTSAVKTLPVRWLWQSLRRSRFSRIRRAAMCSVMGLPIFLK